MMESNELIKNSEKKVTAAEGSSFQNRDFLKVKTKPSNRQEKKFHSQKEMSGHLWCNSHPVSHTLPPHTPLADLRGQYPQ